MPGAPDPLTAKIAESTGFEAIQMPGSPLAAVTLGAPDLGLTTLTEVVTQARNIANSVNIPIIADAESGFGDVLNVMRAIKEFEKAGVAGIHIEDLEKPQCGLYRDKNLIPVEEMAEKIRAARDVLEDPDFTIVARTDALGAVNGGVKEAVRRANTYAKAGADIIWFMELPIGEGTVDVVSKLPGLIKAPVLGVGGQETHTLTDFEEWGYKIVMYGTNSTQAMMGAIVNLMKDLKEKARDAAFCRELPNRGVTLEYLYDFVKFDEYQNLRTKYSPDKR